MRLDTTALVLGLILMSAPALAGTGTLGQWHCAIRSVAAGDLTIRATSYTYLAPTDAGGRDGALNVVGKSIEVINGPLKDDLGMEGGRFAGAPDLPSYYTSGDPVSLLVFGGDEAARMTCLPTYPDPERH